MKDTIEAGTTEMTIMTAEIDTMMTEEGIDQHKAIDMITKRTMTEIETAKKTDIRIEKEKIIVQRMIQVIKPLTMIRTIKLVVVDVEATEIEIVIGTVVEEEVETEIEIDTTIEIVIDLTTMTDS